MVRYYVIREYNGRTIAIHKTPDSAQACFIEICARESFRGDELKIVVIQTDDRGIVMSEITSFLYLRGRSDILEMK
jgi:hypothetical protein